MAVWAAVGENLTDNGEVKVRRVQVISGTTQVVTTLWAYPLGQAGP